jgi:hypothetical protein
MSADLLSASSPSPAPAPSPAQAQAQASSKHVSSMMRVMSSMSRAFSRSTGGGKAGSQIP